MPYCIFLDDERNPADVTWVEYSHIENFIVVRTVEEFKELIETNGPPEFVSFDHDLATELTGYDAVKALVEHDRDVWNGLWNMNYVVHSKNPIGAKSINDYVGFYKKWYNQIFHG